MVVWDKKAAKVDVFHRYPQHVVIVITEPNRFTWLLSGVYDNTDYLDRRFL